MKKDIIRIKRECQVPARKGDKIIHNSSQDTWGTTLEYGGHEGSTGREREEHEGEVRNMEGEKRGI